jgi:folate-binding protein YgfZ
MTIPEGYDAARGHSAFLVRPGRGKIAVAGNDRRTYLHAMLTNDIAPLEPGTGCYAAYLTPQGRMIADTRVFEVGDLILLEVPGDRVAIVLHKLDEFVFSEDVKLGDLTEAFEEVRVVGPAAAAAVVAALKGQGEAPPQLPSAEELADWPEFRNARTSMDGEMVLLAASRDLGLPGFDLFVERSHAERLSGALLAAGAARLSPEAAHALRVEAGTPLFGADMDAATIPLEAGIDERAISLTKGCYPGQEVIIRVLHRGHGRVARRLVGLEVAGEAVPAAGATLRAADRDVGRVTSAAWSPHLAKPIALGYVLRDFLEPGTPLTIAHGGDWLGAAVTTLPFVRR